MRMGPIGQAKAGGAPGNPCIIKCQRPMRTNGLRQPAKPQLGCWREQWAVGNPPTPAQGRFIVSCELNCNPTCTWQLFYKTAVRLSIRNELFTDGTTPLPGFGQLLVLTHQLNLEPIGSTGSSSPTYARFLFLRLIFAFMVT